jgi:hypothetical protein
VEPEVGLDLVLRRGVDERVQRCPDLLAGDRIRAGGRKRRRLTLDPEPEVDHVEHVMVGADGRGLDSERRRLRHRQHERATALEGFDQTLGPQPRHRLADDRA